MHWIFGCCTVHLRSRADVGGAAALCVSVVTVKGVRDCDAGRKGTTAGERRRCEGSGHQLRIGLVHWSNAHQVALYARSPSLASPVGQRAPLSVDWYCWDVCNPSSCSCLSSSLPSHPFQSPVPPPFATILPRRTPQAPPPFFSYTSSHRRSRPVSPLAQHHSQPQLHITLAATPHPTLAAPPLACRLTITASISRSVNSLCCQ